MSEMELGLILLAVVVAVIVATRPAPPRKRRTRSTRPPVDDAGPKHRRSRLTLHRNAKASLPGSAMHRNPWDRPDLAAGIGHNHETSDASLSLWPSPR
jgi:hypothetical protein